MNIGVFDSGLGGLSILRKFLTLLPAYNYVYLGDNKNVPYGEKTPEEIFQLTCRAIDFLSEKKDCSLIVLTCNTASTVLPRIQQTYLPQKHPNLKVLGVIRVAAESIIESPHQPVGIMATDATVKSNSFIQELKKLKENPKLYQQSCPELVPLIESGNLTDGTLQKAVHMYTEMLKNQGAKSILLGCTHYELIAEMVAQESGLPVIAEGRATAEKLVDYLKRHSEIDLQLAKDQARHYFFTRLDPMYTQLIKRFIGASDTHESIEEVTIASQ